MSVTSSDWTGDSSRPQWYPADYGFVPDTLAEDGDPLDTLVLLEDPTFPGCVVRARPVGVFWMGRRERSGRQDHLPPGGRPRLRDGDRPRRPPRPPAGRDRPLLRRVQGSRAGKGFGHPGLRGSSGRPGRDRSGPGPSQRVIGFSDFTGRTIRPKVALTTPAKEAYQHATAVRIPNQPAALISSLVTCLWSTWRPK